MKVFQLYQWQCTRCAELLSPMPNRPDDVVASGKARFYHPETPGRVSQCPDTGREVWIPIAIVELETV